MSLKKCIHALTDVIRCDIFTVCYFKANKLNAPAAEVIVNGQSAGVLAFALYTLDVTPF